MVTFLKSVIVLVVVSFMLHLPWEFFHRALYTDYGALSGSLPIYLWATIGDVLYTLAAFALVSAFKGHTAWVLRATRTDYLGLITVGFFLALYVEYKALALGRWAYTDAMPIVPFLEVGLSPLLQMMILLPLSVMLVAVIMRFVARQ